MNAMSSSSHSASTTLIEGELRHRLATAIVVPRAFTAATTPSVAVQLHVPRLRYRVPVVNFLYSTGSEWHQAMESFFETFLGKRALEAGMGIAS